METMKQKLQCKVLLITKKRFDSIDSFIKNVYALKCLIRTIFTAKQGI